MDVFCVFMCYDSRSMHLLYLFLLRRFDGAEAATGWTLLLQYQSLGGCPGLVYPPASRVRGNLSSGGAAQRLGQRQVEFAVPVLSWPSFAEFNTLEWGELRGDVTRTLYATTPLARQPPPDVYLSTDKITSHRIWREIIINQWMKRRSCYVRLQQTRSLGYSRLHSINIYLYSHTLRKMN